MIIFIILSAILITITICLAIKLSKRPAPFQPNLTNISMKYNFNNTLMKELI